MRGQGGWSQGTGLVSLIVRQGSQWVEVAWGFPSKQCDIGGEPPQPLAYEPLFGMQSVRDKAGG